MNPDLGQLRDIHLPAPVSWWPPAPGWWILAMLLLCSVVIVYLLARRHRREGWRRAALAELAQLRYVPPQEQIAGISALLRRVAISRFPRSEVAALTGDAWLAFLDRAFRRERPFQKGAGEMLVHGPYVRTTHADTGALLALCERWIKRLPAKEAR